MLSRRSLIILVAGAAAPAVAPAFAQTIWKTYRNARFGTRIEYPSDLFRALPPPENGDGLKFAAGDGAQFTVSAIRNALEETFDQIQDGYLKDRDPSDRITYRARGPDWFVLSGTRGD